MKVYIYSKCSTCKKAVDFLKKRGYAASITYKEIVETPPTIDELKTMLGYMKGDIRKLFNTSGMLYREMGLSEKLKTMPQSDALTLLHAHGMLVKRPFVLGKGFGLLGFKEKEWEALLGV